MLGKQIGDYYVANFALWFPGLQLQQCILAMLSRCLRRCTSMWTVEGTLHPCMSTTWIPLGQARADPNGVMHHPAPHLSMSLFQQHWLMVCYISLQVNHQKMSWVFAVQKWCTLVSKQNEHYEVSFQFTLPNLIIPNCSVFTNIPCFQALLI